MKCSITISLLSSLALVSGKRHKRKPKPPSDPPQTPFLKEIITGRCYANPPTTPEHCPNIAASFMSIFEGQLDANITPDSFSTFFDQVDFSSLSADKEALFFVNRREKNSRKFGDNDLFMTVHQTPGGKMIRDLVFCGVDQQAHCPFGTLEEDKEGGIKWHGAQASFWSKAYEKFASQTSGSVHMIITANTNKDDDDNFFYSHVIPNLNPLQVTSVDIILLAENDDITCDSNAQVMVLKQAVTQRGFSLDNITCKEDSSTSVMHALICMDDDDEVSADPSKTALTRTPEKEETPEEEPEEQLPGEEPEEQEPGEEEPEEEQGPGEEPSKVAPPPPPHAEKENEIPLPEPPATECNYKTGKIWSFVIGFIVGALLISVLSNYCSRRPGYTELPQA